MRKPFEYQETAIELAINTNLLLTDECGLGKSLVAVHTGLYLQRFYTEPHLVVTTKASREQWVSEIFSEEPTANVMVVGDPDTQLPTSFPNYSWIITYYEALLGVGSGLRNHLWGMVVADEAHRIRNRRAQRSTAVKKLAARRKIALTATPWETSPADMWSILNYLFPMVYKSFWNFSDKYAKTIAGYKGYTKVVGAKNLDLLEQELSGLWLARRKVDVAKHLPPLTHQVVPIRLEDQQRKVYDIIYETDDLIADLSEFGADEQLIKSALARITKLLQVASDPHNLDVNVPSTKLQWIEGFIEGNPTEKVLVFTTFRETALRIGAYFRVPVVLGGMTDTSQKIKSFVEGHTKVLVATIATLGEAFNIDAATCAVYVDLTWSQTLMTQSLNRIHRITTTTPKVAYFLTAIDTVDELVLHTFNHKLTERELALAFLNRHHHHTPA